MSYELQSESEGMARWPSCVVPHRAPQVQGLLMGAEGPVPVLGHYRRSSAVLITTQAKLALAMVTV